jgi:hypothetical protein
MNSVETRAVVSRLTTSRVYGVENPKFDVCVLLRSLIVDTVEEIVEPFEWIWIIMCTLAAGFDEVLIDCIWASRIAAAGRSY